MRRVFGVVAIVAIQAALVGIWLAVEQAREPDLEFEIRDEPAPSATLPDGIVHFWATWCVPCRTELPGLIAAARAAGMPLVAITAEQTAVVEAFFEGAVPAEVRLDAAAPERWRVTTLPDTFVVADGRVVARISGARDWTGRAGRRFLEEVRGR